MTKIDTIQSVAKEMLKNLEKAKRTDGSSFVRTKKEIKWQKDIIHNAHGDNLPDDYIYQFIEDALCVLADCREGEEDDCIYQIEADVYTSDLTKWLHSSNNRVYYLDEAISNGAKDGFGLLAMAQTQEKQEVAQAVLQGIREHIEGKE